MTGKVRIISGIWRGRKLEVLDLPGLRPSGDRSRETLFNWLGPSIHGLHCLDLFAGTGVLGLEAASRGAGTVTLVEKSAQAANHIKQQVNAWPEVDRVEIITADALVWLTRQSSQYDLVFIDPPHDHALQIQALKLLLKHHRLRDGARLCVEHGIQEQWVGDQQDWLDANFQRLKSGRFGQVEISLFKVSAL